MPDSLSKQIILDGLLKIRSYTAKYRTLPDFYILGVQKGGTSTVFGNLLRHPNIKKPYLKELRYFLHASNPKAIEYRKFFPLESKDRDWKTGEATPAYLYYPLVAKRIKKITPNAKFIVLLRDPVQRAVSQYYHYKRNGISDLSFNELIKKEKEIFPIEPEKLERAENKLKRPYLRYSILRRGQYARQLKHWFKYFDKEQFLILKSEEVFTSPKSQYNKIFQFLNVDPEEFQGNLIKKNINESKGHLSEDQLELLEKYYSDLNEELEDLTNGNFSLQVLPEQMYFLHYP